MARPVGARNLLGTFTCGNCSEKIENATSEVLAAHLRKHSGNPLDAALHALDVATTCRCPEDYTARDRHAPGAWCDLRPEVDEITAALEGFRPVAAAALRVRKGAGEDSMRALYAAVDNLHRAD